jgi:phage terminase Nu1 subunit (DNA packaging protein)
MKSAPIRWTAGVAALEFGMDRRVVAERLRMSGAVPGEDGKFSTRQIVAAIHGDLAGEKLRLMRAQADLAEIERDEALRTRIPLETVGAVMQELHGGIASIINASKLPQRDKDDICADIRGFGLRMKEKGYKLPEAQKVNNIDNQ